MSSRKVYPPDVSDEEWEFVAPYLTLLREDADQRVHSLRDVFDALRWMVKAGCPWRMLPGEFPPWQAVQQQGERCVAASCFQAMVHDLRELMHLLNERNLYRDYNRGTDDTLRELMHLLNERNPRPTAAILDGRTLQSSPESGGPAGYDGYKRKKGSKVHIAVDTLGHLLALLVTPANEPERAQVGELAKQVQEATQHSVDLAYVDQGYTGEKGCRCGSQGRHRVGGRQTRGSQTRVRVAASTPGSRTLLRLAGPFSAAFARLRTPAYHPRRAPLASF